MKSTEIDLKFIIDEKYLMPKNMMEAYRKRLDEAIPEKKIGRPRADLTRILHGIYYLLKTGMPWEALPKIFGQPKTVYDWFVKLTLLNIFDKTWTDALRKLQEKNLLHLDHQSIDSSHRKAMYGGSLTGPSPVDRAKPGSKFIIQTDRLGLPLGLTISSSNKNDQKLLQQTFLDAIKRLFQRDSAFLHADKGFDSKENAAFIRPYGMTRIAPTRKYKKRKIIQTDSTPDSFRWVVERTIALLTRFRRILIRYDRSSKYYLSWCQLGAQTLCFLKL